MSHTPFMQRELNGGTQQVYRFDNGLGASVVQHKYSYGGDNGKWELGVIKFDGDKWELTYETEVTSDVIGYLDWHEVESLLDQIAALQAA